MSTPLFRLMRGPIGLQAILMLVGAVAVFAVDTFTPLDIEITVLYAVLVIASASFLGRRGIQIVSCLCVLQRLLSYVIVHGGSVESGPLLRALTSPCAIGMATLSALRNRGACFWVDGQKANVT